MPVPFPHAGYMNKLWDQVEFVINCGAHRHAVDGRRRCSTHMVRERVTVGQGVPTQWASSSTCPQLADADLSSLRLASTGSAPVTPELAEKMRTRLGCPIVVRYACTESSSITGTRARRSARGAAAHRRPPAGGHRARAASTKTAHAVPARRGRRGHAALAVQHARLLERSRAHRRDAVARRLDHHQRPRAAARRRQPRAVRPHQRDVHPRRLQRPPARGRARRSPTTRRSTRVAIVGTPAPTIGEIGVAFVEPRRSRRSADARRAARVRARAAGRLQGARPARGRRRAADDRRCSRSTSACCRRQPLRRREPPAAPRRRRARGSAGSPARRRCGSTPALVLGERAHLDEAHHVVDAGVARAAPRRRSRCRRRRARGRGCTATTPRSAARRRARSPRVGRCEVLVP